MEAVKLFSSKAVATAVGQESTELIGSQENDLRR